jgi:hypothetical protein
LSSLILSRLIFSSACNLGPDEIPLRRHPFQGFHKAEEWKNSRGDRPTRNEYGDADEYLYAEFDAEKSTRGEN